MAPLTTSVFIFSDAGASLAQNVVEEEQIDALHDLVDVIEDILEKVLRQPQFRHVQVAKVDMSDGVPEDVPSALCVGFAGSLEHKPGQATPEASDFYNFVDIQGLLTGKAQLPESLKDKVEIEEGLISITDEQLRQRVDDAVRRAGGTKRYNSFLKLTPAEALDEALSAATDAAIGEGEQEGVAFDPFDVLQLAVAQVVQTAGVAPPAPSLLNRIGGILGAPQRVLGLLGRRTATVQRLWWRLEDLVVDGGKFAIKFGVKAARPVLVGLVLHRVLRTVSDSRSLGYRMAKLPVEQRMPYYYSKLLGPDWEKQLEEDLAAAVRDVDEGLDTEDIAHEKRKVSAAIIRRLELEDWDKERMKNFYLASYGGLKWFEFMENALKNPVFMTSRGWNDRVVNWVGENEAFPDDLPQSKDRDLAEYALSVVEKSLGRPLSDEERAGIVARVAPAPSDLLPESRALRGVLLPPVKEEDAAEVALEAAPAPAQ